MSPIRSIARILAGFGAVLAFLQGAAAEPNPAACQRYRAELANLRQDANRGQIEEIQRLVSYRQSIGCEGGRFLFFDMRPPQCAQVEQRIRALNAGYGAGATQVSDARRAQLIEAVKDACTGLPPAAPKTADGTAAGGSRVICVRTCDGAYFPMANLPDGREGADQMCKALCPGTEAAAYSMPPTDNGLHQAAAIATRRSYASLPNAFRFQKTFVPNCSCKAEGQTWAQSLVKAESMLVRHKGDIFVTPAQAEMLSRPKVRLTLVGRADRTAAAVAATAAARGEDTLTEAGTASDARHPAGPEERAPIRIIAPDVVPVPAQVRLDAAPAATP
ncbi:MAG: DUF2865 domain-containing protein [Methylobacterium frigidaeris]